MHLTVASATINKSGSGILPAMANVKEPSPSPSPSPLPSGIMGARAVDYEAMAVTRLPTPESNPIKNQKDLNQRLIHYMEEMCRDHNNRVAFINNYISNGENETEALDALNRGFYYGNEYYDLLEQTKNIKKLELLFKNDSFVYGYPPTVLSADNTSTEQITTEKMMERAVVEKPYDGKKTRHTCYILDATEYKPSQILAAWQKSLCFMGCGQLIHFAAYRVAQDVWGKEKFDSFFPNGSFRLTTTLNNPFDPISAFFRVHNIKQDQEFIAGQSYNFTNHPCYGYRDLSGDSGAWNVVCSDATSGEETFIGFGLPLHCTALDIKKALVGDYNATPYNERVFSPAKKEEALKKVQEAQDYFLKNNDSIVPENISIDEFDHSGAGLDRRYSFELSLNLLRNEDYVMKLKADLA